MHKQPWKPYLKASPVSSLVGYAKTQAITVPLQQPPTQAQPLSSFSPSRNKARPNRSFIFVIKPEGKFTVFDPSRYMSWAASLQLICSGETEVDQWLQMLLDKELIPVTAADGRSRILSLHYQFSSVAKPTSASQSNISFLSSLCKVWRLQYVLPASSSKLLCIVLLKWLQKCCHRDTVNCSFCVYFFFIF